MQATSLHYATAARVLGTASRRDGLIVPSFRTPPRPVGVHRTLTRRADGSPTVSVRLKGRPWPAVLADMIEGVVVANELAPPEADAARAAMWSAVADASLVQRDADEQAADVVAPHGRSAPTETGASRRDHQRDPTGGGGGRGRRHIASSGRAA